MMDFKIEFVVFDDCGLWYFGFYENKNNQNKDIKKYFES